LQPTKKLILVPYKKNSTMEENATNTAVVRRNQKINILVLGLIKIRSVVTPCDEMTLSSIQNAAQKRPYTI
jgi:hypothetical protein